MTVWVPYVTIGVPLVLGLLLWWVLPGAIGGWLVVPFWVVTYFVMRTVLRRLFLSRGLD